MKQQSREKVGTYHVSSKTSVAESCMIKSFGNAPLKAIRKNSYAENSLKKFRTKFPFWQCRLQLYGFHYSGYILLANQYD